MRRMLFAAAAVLCCSPLVAAPGDPLPSQVSRLNNLQSSLPPVQIQNPKTLREYWTANSQLQFRMAARNIAQALRLQAAGLPYDPFGMWGPPNGIDPIDKSLRYAEFYLQNATAPTVPPALPPNLAPAYP